jgi:glycine/D-amino acid oxidase-like deaminating enzyme
VKLQSGQPYFLLKNGKLNSCSALSSDITTDIAIIGAGISGALMAYTLLRNGLGAIVLDRHEAGCGSTGASTALLQYEIDAPLSVLAEQKGIRHASTVYQLSVKALELIRNVSEEVGYNGYHSCSSLYFAHAGDRAPFLKKEYEIRKKAGIAVKLLLAAELESYYGLKSEAGILSANAAKLDPYLFTEKIHCYNRKHGVQLFTGTCISNIRYEEGYIHMRTDKGFHIRSKKLIYASGYETLDEIDLPVKLKTTYAFAGTVMKELPDLFKDTVMWNTGDPYLYLREDAGRLIVGGRDEDFSGTKDTVKKTKRLCEDLKRYFPVLSPEPEYSWSGTFAETKDGLPYIGDCPTFPGAYFALGFGGNGITFSAIAAEIITGLIKKTRPENGELFRLNR